VEVIKTEATSQEVVSTMVEFSRSIGKEPAVVIDSLGFIANRLIQVYRNESFKAYDDGLASLEDIDKAFKAAYNFRLGPFELGDLVGLEKALGGSEKLYRETGRDIFRPARCQVMKFRAGDYGRETGRGFYQY